MRAGEAARGWLSRHPFLWRALVLAVAAGFGIGGLVVFSFGGCHDSGGFCSDEFSSTHVEAYASGAVLVALAALGVALVFTRRPWKLATAAVLAGVVAGVAAVALEATH
ncbi:MAG TPA: hypothetical protein VM030_04470 [Acidimicrobiales bacterium]|nr:hypothetical protein [Acidimicrobiales bacterium]